jgi:hypothetical protein
MLLRFPHFRHPWRSAGKMLLRFPHFRHPWRSRVRTLYQKYAFLRDAVFGGMARNIGQGYLDISV